MSGAMLIAPADLARRLSRTVVLDASWHMPDAGRDAQTEFESAHIPGARRFDIDRIADPASGLPHTLPPPEAFARMVGALGIGNASEVVVYENGPPFAAPRAWWMFRVMGHDAVAMLDGGLPRWRAEGFAVETGGAREAAPAAFEARFRPERHACADDVAAALAGAADVADARSADRFAGRVDEPRPGVRAGHMPGARNLPYSALIGDDGRLVDAASARAAFEAAGVDLDRPVVTTCGSGVTAAILAMALERLGTPAAVYDGSWTEWGSDPSRPVERS